MSYTRYENYIKACGNLHFHSKQAYPRVPERIYRSTTMVSASTGKLAIYLPPPKPKRTVKTGGCVARFRPGEPGSPLSVRRRGATSLRFEAEGRKPPAERPIPRDAVKLISRLLDLAMALKSKAPLSNRNEISIHYSLALVARQVIHMLMWWGAKHIMRLRQCIRIKKI